MFSHFDFKMFVVQIVVLILSITLHEFGHAYSADLLGDDTPRRQGRVTLWPDKHFDPIGLIMIMITTATGYGLGWGKPVEVNFRNFKNEARADVIVTACGPLMNLLIAIVSGLIMRFVLNSPDVVDHSVAYLFASTFLWINVSLMVFNLLPIFPLDGSHLLRRALGRPYGEQFYAFSVQWGPIILLLAIVTGSQAIYAITEPMRSTVMALILGTHQ